MDVRKQSRSTERRCPLLVGRVRKNHQDSALLEYIVLLPRRGNKKMEKEKKEQSPSLQQRPPNPYGCSQESTAGWGGIPGPVEWAKRAVLLTPSHWPLLSPQGALIPLLLLSL